MARWHEESAKVKFMFDRCDGDGKERRMKTSEQLLKWLDGESVHNNGKDECCPDFSCCNSMIHTPYEIRKAFVEAFLTDDHQETNRMLGWFLRQAIASQTGVTGPNIYIAGIEGEPE
ncbi:hypothetical protein LCGC14_1188320 [marine sediment metagenome]|uniref:Uncharacterized protein n=1 Tax=marine sediment metagenome TaxID=412755 RepID=A0A0F9P2X2_9ZZZZ